MLTLKYWPIEFFHKACFPIWELSEKAFIGTGSRMAEDHDFETDTINRWRIAKPESAERLTNFEQPDFQIARNREYPNDVLLLHHTTIIGEYGQRNIVIHKGYRGLCLSTILILAKATVINAIPNPNRRYTEAGRAAMASAYRWICRKRKKFERDSN